MLELLGMLALLAALVPVCMSGAQMIAAFMTGQRILAWVIVTLVCMMALVGGAWAALVWVLPLMEAYGSIWGIAAAAVIALPAWGAYAAGKFWMGKTV